MKNDTIVDHWTELSNEDAIRLRGGPEPIELAIGLAALFMAGWSIILQYSANNKADAANAAANLANEMTTAQWKFQNDPMSLSEHERDILGLNNNIPTVYTSSATMEVHFSVGGSSYPGALDLTVYNWWDLQNARTTFDIGNGGGGGQDIE